MTLFDGAYNNAKISLAIIDRDIKLGYRPVSDRQLPSYKTMQKMIAYLEHNRLVPDGKKFMEVFS